jgi:hypothetical protein
MMGCLGRVGCLVILVMILVLSVAAWFARDWVMDNVPFGQRHAAQQSAVWQSATPDGAKRATTALAGLQRRGGPVFANVTPGDMLAYILKEFAAVLPKSADSIQAAVIGERLHIRAVVKASDLGTDVLGPLAYVVRDRERVEFGGTLRVIRPGFSEYQVKTFRVRDMSLPQSALPLLIRQLGGSSRPKELAADGLPLVTPEYIGDVRVANGRITVYKRQ